MGFYPAHWLKPIANTTAQWSFKEFLASRKKAAPGKAAAYPSAPLCAGCPRRRSLSGLTAGRFNAGFFFGTLARFYSQSHGVNPFFH